MKSTAAFALVLAGAMHAALAAPIVATPGSLAGYTYFPAATSSGGGSSAVGDEVSTLQRCVFTPTAGDQTVRVDEKSLYGYTKPIQIIYTMAGGDGGAGYAGGGGGSSAILHNGTLKELAPGADGGQISVVKYGRFAVNANDQIRFVTGGGGGDGISYSDPMGNAKTIGGGGGAGYTGAGAGGSSANRAITSASDILLAAGKGGGASPGVGGFVSGGFSGTNATGMQGGVSTFPDGSSAPMGAASSKIYSTSSSIMGSTYTAFFYEPTPSRIPATDTTQGSWSRYFLYPYYQGGDVVASLNGQTKILGNTVSGSGLTYMFAGGGGSLGRAGTPSVFTNLAYRFTSGMYGSVGGPVMNWSGTRNDLGYPGDTRNNGHTINSFARPTADINLTKTTNDGISGASPGQIVVSYQAPVCGVLQ